MIRELGRPCTKLQGIVTAIADIRVFNTHSERYISIEYVYTTKIHKTPQFGLCVFIAKSKTNKSDISLLDKLQSENLKVGDAIYVELDIDAYVDTNKGLYIAKNVLRNVEILPIEEQKQIINSLKTAKNDNR